ncbi:MAG: ABC transporter permease [Bacteroidota bacterium]
MQRVLFNFILALEGVFANKLRAFLTALGIIFGVGAVIAMLAIGTGAKQAILQQMELIGSNNIVIKAAEPAQGADGADGQLGEEKLPEWSPGLTMKDVHSIQTILPSVQQVSPEIVLSVQIIQSGKTQRAKCIGVYNSFFQLNNLSLESGHLFHQRHLDAGRPVCIIGKNIQNKFFSEKSPLGQKIKCGKTWLTIIGVLEKKIAKQENLKKLGIRDYNDDVYIPVSTALLRFKNRSIITKEDIKSQFDDDEEAVQSLPNYHQLDRLVVRVRQSDELLPSSALIGQMLKRRHRGIVDYEINVPEKELEAQQETQDTFNKVLAFIAGISLLVGGIGIMNIMLASVLERTKEIGVRRSLGAKKQDIILQFLFEAVFISLIGGLIGVILGVGAAQFIASNYDIPTVVSGWSVALSFIVASAVGLIFGIFPARNAAQMDPIKALRTD